MKTLFFLLITIVLVLFEPLAVLIAPGVSVYLPPLVFWFLLWLFLTEQSEKQWYLLAFVAGVLLDAIQQTYLGFYVLNILFSIIVGTWLVQGIVHTNKFLTITIVTISALLFVVGEYAYLTIVR